MKKIQMAAMLGILVSVFPASQAFTAGGGVNPQDHGPINHEHAMVMACVDVPVGQKRPDIGCFNLATEKGLQFVGPSVYWHLRTFSNRLTAEAAKSATGIVVEEDGRVWLSEFGPRNLALHGGQPVAVIGPLELPAAKSYNAVIAYAAMRPGDRAVVHTHPGPEAWYLIAGEQCLETPTGTKRAKAGGTMAAAPNVPMDLSITGTALRKAIVLVIHDSAQPQAIPSEWKPVGGCSR